MDKKLVKLWDKLDKEKRRFWGIRSSNKLYNKQSVGFNYEVLSCLNPLESNKSCSESCSDLGFICNKDSG